MLDGDPPPEEEFVAEENVNFKRPRNVGAVSADDDTVPASNLPPPQDLSRPNISTGKINCFYRYIILY
jgi:hypothetical protein